MWLRYILILGILLSLVTIAVQKIFDLRVQFHNDSLLPSDKTRLLAIRQTRFETVEKGQRQQVLPKKLASLQEKSRQQTLLRDQFLLGQLIVLFIMGLIIRRQCFHIRKYQELLRTKEEIFRTELALLQAELENVRLQKLNLLEELESKNKELTSYSLHFIQKNELLEEVKEGIKQLKKLRGQESAKELHGLNRLVENNLQIDKDWETFKRHFEEVHKDFYRDLKDYYPDLTNNDLKLCTLLKLNMNLKEAAPIMGVSPDGIKKARYRLRKKFNLGQEENLIDHIISLEKHNRHIRLQVQAC